MLSTVVTGTPRREVPQGAAAMPSAIKGAMDERSAHLNGKAHRRPWARLGARLGYILLNGVF